MVIRIQRQANASKQTTLLDGVVVGPSKWPVCGCGLNRSVHESMNDVSNVKVHLDSQWKCKYYQMTLVALWVWFGNVYSNALSHLCIFQLFVLMELFISMCSLKTETVTEKPTMCISILEMIWNDKKNTVYTLTLCMLGN